MAKKPTYDELKQRVKELEKEVAKGKSTYESLLKSEENLRFYKFAIDNMENFKMAVIDKKYRYRIVSQWYMNEYGNSENEIIGKSVADLMGKAIFEQVIKNNIDNALGGKPVNYQAWFDFASGRKLMDVFYYPIKGREEIIVIVNDITERKQADEEKKKLEVQLQMSQRMEAIGTLAGGIAHDFNNLLMGIQGNASLMFKDIDSSHPHYERLESIEKQIQGGVKLTSQILGYARKGKYEVIPISLNHIINETSDTFGQTKKEIVIHKKLAEGLFAIKANQGQIEQVLLNLFVNAADAMPCGGNLYLETKNVTIKDLKNKSYKPTAGKYVLLIVKDTGVGMDKSIAEHIFEPFFTTKEMGRGTGLGLASVYGIIKAHGGYIDVDSKENHGTTFTIYLPATKKKVKKTAKTSDKLIKGTGAVLLVDDEKVVQEVCKELLNNIGYRVFSAIDGKEALKLYRKNQNMIDLVLLDMTMPNMSGGEVYDRLKEINPGIKVLLSSGYCIDGEATDILDRGCDGFIQKPFDIKKLSAKIGEILKNK